ncbi:alpha/beta-hydrolase [Ceratobasidium sp. AG-I]|nr:alpha/beta-hydrolase [Ceratobasidium sp. AG-I]
MKLSLIPLLALASGALSAPAFLPRGLSVFPSSSINSMTLTQADAYTPYAWFAAATYCPRASQASWTCGSCQADPVKDFQVYASGGDGGLVQFWYVGWWPSEKSVIVAHQGTELNNTIALATDLTLLLVPPNQNRFPGSPLFSMVHAGFQAAHERTADVILATVKKVIAEKSATRVVSVGHSLGGALAYLEGLHLRLKLPAGVSVVTRTFGQPRVGNGVFADFMDKKVTDVVRVTNKRDVVPTIPPLGMLYAHSSGEKHVNAQGAWSDCAGQDNSNVNCSRGQTLVQGVAFPDHLGPYSGGVMLGTGSDGALC